jgi:UPF0716 protein FxsA
MVLLPLLLLLILVPIAEIALIIQVGEWIGVWWTLALLLADAVLGSVLLRSQGRAVWRHFSAAVSEGRIPHREVMDGVLVIFGGALMLAPGFITDVIGALFLLPPTRALMRRLLTRRAVLRIVGTSPPPSRNGHPDDIEATAFDVDPDRLDPPR